MLDWDAIADRFFSMYAGEPQAEIMRRYGTTRAQVSRWKTHGEKIPLRVLEKLVELEGVTWDWILAGRGPKHWRPAAPVDKPEPRPCRPERKKGATSPALPAQARPRRPERKRSTD